MDLEQTLRAVGRALVPIACPGCGREDVPWCDECAAPWWEQAWRAEDGAARLDVDGRPALPVWATAPLAGAAHGMIAAWKDGGRRDLDRFFSGVAGRTGMALAPSLAGLPAPLTVVPAPARAASTRRRGEDLPLRLAAAVADGLTRAGVTARTHPCLAVGAGEQRQVSAADRWRRMSRGVGIVHAPPPSRPVVLVDDVVTTGATLAACVRALESAGAVVVAGVALAAVESVAAGARPGLR